MINEISERIKEAIDKHKEERINSNSNARNEADRELYKKLGQICITGNLLEQLNSDLKAANTDLKAANTDLKGTNTDLKEAIRKTKEGKLIGLYNLYSIFTTIFFGFCQSIINLGIQTNKGLVQKYKTAFGEAEKEGMNFCFNECLTSYKNENSIDELHINCLMPKGAYEKLSLTVGIVWLIMFVILLISTCYIYFSEKADEPKEPQENQSDIKDNISNNNSAVQLNNYTANNASKTLRL